jgi:hypothetical protein
MSYKKNKVWHNGARTEDSIQGILIQGGSIVTVLMQEQ